MSQQIDVNKLTSYLLRKGVERKLQPTSLRLINLIIIDLLKRKVNRSGPINLLGLLPIVGPMVQPFVNRMMELTVLKNFNVKQMADKLHVEERSISRAIGELVENGIIKKEKSEEDKRAVEYSVLIPPEVIRRS